MPENLLLKDSRERLTEALRTVYDFPKPGVAFKDIQSVLIRPTHYKLVKQGLISLLPKSDSEPNTYEYDAIVAFDARGFIFGFSLAEENDAKFIMARKPGKLPPPCKSFKFNKEYGAETIEIEEGIIQPGDRVLIHDDVLATGGTASAAAEIILSCGGIIAGFNFIIELKDLGGRAVLEKYTGNTPSAETIASLLVF